MKNTFLYFLILNASLLEKTLFDNGDLDKSLTLVDKLNTPRDFYISYFLKKVFLNKQEESLIDMILSKDLFSVTYCTKVLCTNEMYDDTKNIADMLLKISEKTSEKYLQNPYDFSPKYNFKEKAIPNKYMRVMIYSLEPKGINLFFSYLDSKTIRLGDYIEELRYLAKNNILRAYGYLGEAYYYGINVKKSIDKSLNYFLKGKAGGDQISYNGIGKILMSEEYKDYTGAKQHLEIANALQIISETDYLLYILYQKYFALEQYASFYLSKAISNGYLPAIFQDGKNFFKKGDFVSAIIRFQPIIDFSDDIMYYQEIAHNKFKRKEYKQALLVCLMLVEMGSVSAISNAIFLLETHRLLKDQDKILFNLYIKMSKTSLRHLSKIGNCYFYGKGIDKSYTDAFAYYLSAASQNDAEGLLSLSYMYENGLGVKKDLLKAFKYIRSIRMNDRNYLLIYYSHVLFVLRVICNVYMLVSIVTGYVAYKILFK